VWFWTVFFSLSLSFPRLQLSWITGCKRPPWELLHQNPLEKGPSHAYPMLQPC
jgi:hypothetical protein